MKILLKLLILFAVCGLFVWGMVWGLNLENNRRAETTFTSFLLMMPFVVTILSRYLFFKNKKLGGKPILILLAIFVSIPLGFMAFLYWILSQINR